MNANVQVAPAVAVDQAEIEAIVQTILDYAECNYTGAYERRDKALHPELAKRTVAKNDVTGNDVIAPMSRSQAIEVIRARYVRQEKPPEEAWRRDILIYDVYGNVASAKVLVKDWFDYLHLVKVNGEWKIINVLWQGYGD